MAVGRLTTGSHARHLVSASYVRLSEASDLRTKSDEFRDSKSIYRQLTTILLIAIDHHGMFVRRYSILIKNLAKSTSRRSNITSKSRTTVTTNRDPQQSH